MKNSLKYFVCGNLSAILMFKIITHPSNLTDELHNNVDEEIKRWYDNEDRFPIKNMYTVYILYYCILRKVSLQYPYSIHTVYLQFFCILYVFGNLHTVSYIRY